MLFRAVILWTAVQTATPLNSCLDFLKCKELFRRETVCWTVVQTVSCQNICSYRLCSEQYTFCNSASGQRGQPGAQGVMIDPRTHREGKYFTAPPGILRFFFILSSVQRFLQGFWRLIFQEWTPSSGNYYVSFAVFQHTGRVSSVFH